MARQSPNPNTHARTLDTKQMSVLPAEAERTLHHSACIFEDTGLGAAPKCGLVMMS